jgi:hypothetical protein
MWGVWMMHQNRLLAVGIAAVIAVASYFGVNMFFEAKADEDGRIAAINKARTIGSFIASDEASFGTAYRDGAVACMAAASSTPLPRQVTENYLAVLKAAVAYASEEAYTPRNNERWFLEAQRRAADELPLDENVIGKMEKSEKDKITSAIADIDSGMVKIGNCLYQLAKG